jgi:hypothetical protein
MVRKLSQLRLNSHAVEEPRSDVSSTLAHLVRRTSEKTLLPQGCSGAVGDAGFAAASPNPFRSRRPAGASR